MFGNRIYGCDDCLAVCPWNKFACPTSEPAYFPRAEFLAPRLADLAGLDDPAFRTLFSGSPIKRIGRDRLLRNVLIAIGNSGRKDLACVAERLLEDGSSLVRGAAVWALGRLVPPSEMAPLSARYRSLETDGSVLAEWSASFPRSMVSKPTKIY
jgi:epoxyqueuosine reductase